MSSLSTGTDASPTGSPLAGSLCGPEHGYAPCQITNNGLPECCSNQGFCGVDFEHCLASQCIYGCIDPSYFLLPASSLPSSLSSLQRQLGTTSSSASSSTLSSSIISTTSRTTLQTTITSSRITSSSSSGTQSPSPTSSAASDGPTKHSNIGPIVGGVVGGVVFIALAVWLIWRFCCRDRRSRPSSIALLPRPAAVRPDPGMDERERVPENAALYQSNFQTDSNFRVYENGEHNHREAQPRRNGGL